MAFSVWGVVTGNMVLSVGDLAGGFTKLESQNPEPALTANINEMMKNRREYFITLDPSVGTASLLPNPTFKSHTSHTSSDTPSGIQELAIHILYLDTATTPDSRFPFSYNRTSATAIVSPLTLSTMAENGIQTGELWKGLEEYRYQYTALWGM